MRGVKDLWCNTKTHSQVMSTIRSLLRRQWMMTPMRAEAKRRARVPYVGDSRQRKWHYVCSVCSKRMVDEEVEIDHIEECGELREWSHLSEFARRLFCEADGLRVLCEECHEKRRG